MIASAEVTAMAEAVAAGIRDTLGGQIAGVYLSGSLALGDFIPETSDIDFVAATERAVNQVEFADLIELHARLAAMPNPYAARFEVAYIDRAGLRRFRAGRRHPTLGQGETLDWKEHGENWILERWILRECGLTLFGPHPQTLIDAISSDEVVQAVAARLRDWAEWAHKPDDPEWLLPRSHNAYIVETMCRALFTLAHGTITSKPRAVAWALQTLPEPWRFTVQQSQAWRSDQTPDPAIVPQVMRLIHWAARQSRPPPGFEA